MILLFIVAETALFAATMYLLKKYDEKAGIQIKNADYVLMEMIFAVAEVILFSFYGYGREFFCHSLILYYLMSAAWIDWKTKRVYRAGSSCFIAAAVLFFILNRSTDSFFVLERLSCILIFCLIVVIEGVFCTMGWGDVLTFIGVFFWLGSFDYECMTLEVLAVYMLLANLLFLISNLRKFDWKHRRMKEETAFLPAMAVAALIIFLLINLY